MNIFQPVILALIKKDNKYLLTRRVDDNKDYDNKWQIPGGSLEFAETIEEGLRREVREELGVEIDNLQMIPQIDISVRGSWQGLFIVFVCTMRNKNQSIYLNEEASEYGWFTKQEALKLTLLRGCDEMLEEAEKLS